MDVYTQAHPGVWWSRDKVGEIGEGDSQLSVEWTSQRYMSRTCAGRGFWRMGMRKKSLRPWTIKVPGTTYLSGRSL